jgi:hypothetical protein
LRITDSKYFVHKQDFGLEMGGHGKGQSHIHAARVSLYGSVQELLHFRELHYFVEVTINLGLLHPENGPVHVYVLSSSKFWMESGSDLKEAPDPLRIVRLSIASSSLLNCCLHRTMSRLADLRYPTQEEIIAVYLEFLRSARCYEVHMGESFR